MKNLNKKGLLVAVSTVLVGGLGAMATKAILEHRRHKQEEVLEFVGGDDLAEDVPEEVVEEILNEEEVINTEE